MFKRNLNSLRSVTKEYKGAFAKRRTIQ